MNFNGKAHTTPSKTYKINSTNIGNLSNFEMTNTTTHMYIGNPIKSIKRESNLLVRYLSFISLRMGPLLKLCRLALDLSKPMLWYNQ